MSHDAEIGRRAACVSLLGIGGGLGLLGAGCTGVPERETCVKTALDYKNADFYHSDGTFDAEAAKDVYLEMLRIAGYVIPENPKPRMFAKDWGLGEFVNVGLGGFVWGNDKEANYCALEMLLLPGQMIPEHWHLPTEEAVASHNRRAGPQFLKRIGEQVPGAESGMHEL